MAVKETSIATVLAASIAGGGSYATIDRWVMPRVQANAESAKLAQSKADSANLVTQKLVEDRIKDLRRQLAAETDPVKKAELADRIEAYKEKVRQLEAQLLK